MTEVRTEKTSNQTSGGETSFNGIAIAIVPHPALGDLTVYLRMAWHFHHAGAKVCFFSNSLYSARDYFLWLRIEALEQQSVEDLASKFDVAGLL